MMATLIRDIANWPRFMKVVNPPMIFPDVDDVDSLARVAVTAGDIMPIAMPPQHIDTTAMATVGENSKRARPTPITRKPIAMDMYGRRTSDMRR